MIEPKTKNNTKVKLILDVSIFVAFIIAMDPRSSGVPIHEWLSTAAFAALITHLLLSWDWIVQTTRRIAGAMNAQTRFNYILNWLLFFDVTILMLSGFLISKSVMPFLGVTLPQNFAWRLLHDASANIFLLLLGIHTALHWNWIVTAFTRYVFQPITRLFSTNKKKDVAV